MGKQLIIGLSGYAYVGKDEVGEILCRDHGFKRHAKGDLIKRAMVDIDPMIEISDRQSERLSDLMEGYSNNGDWLAQIDRVKQRYPDARLFMQQLADQLIKTMGHDIWTVRLWEMIEESGDERVVMTRVSLPDEAYPIAAHDGQMWRVNRPGYGPANSHPNEVALDDWAFDRVINNAGSLEDLQREVKEALECLHV